MPKARSRTVAVARSSRVSTRVPTPAASRGGNVCIGVLTGWDERGPLVTFDGSRGAVRARLSSAHASAKVARAEAGREVVLLVDDRPGGAPVLLGFLQAPGTADSELDARIDGKRVELEGRDEIVLRCGQASITLRRNGRVVIRGIAVETNAAGTNRIKGGSVAIN